MIFLSTALITSAFAVETPRRTRINFIDIVSWVLVGIGLNIDLIKHIAVELFTVV